MCSLDNGSFTLDDEERQSLGIKNELSRGSATKDTALMHELSPRAPRVYINPFLTDEARKRVSRALRFQDKDTPLQMEAETEIAPPLNRPTDEELLDLYTKCVGTIFS
jgi:hypothetical protein